MWRFLGGAEFVELEIYGTVLRKYPLDWLVLCAIITSFPVQDYGTSCGLVSFLGGCEISRYVPWGLEFFYLTIRIFISNEGFLNSNKSFTRTE